MWPGSSAWCCWVLVPYCSGIACCGCADAARSCSAQNGRFPNRRKGNELVSDSRGAPGRTRTCNLLLRRQTLYPLSYGRSFQLHTIAQSEVCGQGTGYPRYRQGESVRPTRSVSYRRAPDRNERPPASGVPQPLEPLSSPGGFAGGSGVLSGVLDIGPPAW